MAMYTSSDRYTEQFALVQQQFQEWSPFDQLCAVIELARTFQLSYRHFLSQLCQSQILSENNDIFKHIVDDANAPGNDESLQGHKPDEISVFFF